MSSVIPVWIVTGASGAGKTRLINQLLRAREAHERWAVLVNDFGTSTLAPPHGIAVREVAGCICCTAQVGLRTALVALVRAARPQRVVIEASSAAHVEAVVKVLREPTLARTLALQAIVAVVRGGQITESRYRDNAVYREQLAAADLIVSNAESDDAHARTRALLADVAAKPVVEFACVTPAAIPHRGRHQATTPTGCPPAADSMPRDT